MNLRIIDGGAGTTERPPTDNGMRARLLAMVEECLKGNPQVAMLVWESGVAGGTSQMMSLMTPPSVAVFRGLVDMLHEQAHSEEI